MSPNRVRALRGAACLASVLLFAHCSADNANVDGAWYPDAGTGPGTTADGGKAPGKTADAGKKGGGGKGDAGGTGDDGGDPGDDGGDPGDDGGPSGNDGSVTTACINNPGNEDPGAYPQTDFDPQPSYIPNDTLVLTLDDGPDSNITAKILDLLKARNIKATFFVNTQNWGGPLSLIKRMIDEGHEIGNHTVHHHHLAPGGGSDGIPHESTAAAIETEITGVETEVSTLTGGAIKELTLFRAPFGEPYQSGSQSDKDLVEPVVAKHAVAINWNFDTEDTTTTDANTVVTHFKDLVKTPGAAGASWGIFLMHTVQQVDLDALPQILDYIAQNHFKLARVEEVLCWKFGKQSKDIIPPH